MTKHHVIDTIIKRSPHLSWMEEGTVLLVRHGSHAYGTNVATSDDDFKGICIPPKKYFLGTMHRFEQAELKAPDPDAVIYDIRKFFNLAAQSNPNIIEVLHTSPEDHFLVTPIGQTILDHKDDFLSKKIKFTFMGYAVAQLKRIKLHKRHLLNPPSAPPTRASLGLPEKTLIPQDQLMAAQAEVQKELDKFQFNFMEDMEESQKIDLRSTVSEMLAELKITADQHWESAARKIGLSDNLILVMQREREYTSAKREWDQYQDWKINRNPARAAMEEKYGYDCYVEETEFLTENGWKSFDDISAEEKLATVYMGEAKCKQYFGVEYENYTEKFDGTFTGNLYNLFGNHTDVRVTPNHRMLIKKEERKSGKQSDWSLTEASNLPDTFNIVRQIIPNFKNFSDQKLFDFSILPISSQTFLRLMGWYLSDGAMSFSPKGKADDIRISQIKNGKLYSSMKKFHNKYQEKVPCSFYEYERGPDELHEEKFTEASLSVRGSLPAIMYQECGHVKNKRIPRWIYSLSKYKMEILLDALIGGDGTKSRPDNSMIYYSSLKGLADDVQELAFLCGFETSLYGPYENVKVFNGKQCIVNMYHVHINKTRENDKLLIRSKNIKKIPVENKRIVCFTVPNGTLVTRLNGHVAVHGNSKHAYHLVRLIRMCREILITGKVIVKRPDREELLAIRNGAWSYEQLIEFAAREEQELNELYITSTALPKVPDKEKLDNLCIRLVEQSLENYSRNEK